MPPAFTPRSSYALQGSVFFLQSWDRINIPSILNSVEVNWLLMKIICTLFWGRHHFEGAVFAQIWLFAQNAVVCTFHGPTRDDKTPRRSWTWRLHWSPQTKTPQCEMESVILEIPKHPILPPSHNLRSGTFEDERKPFSFLQQNILNPVPMFKPTFTKKPNVP